MSEHEPQTAMGTIAEGAATGMELAEVPIEERGLRGLELAERMFTPAQREQVAALLMVPANSPALMPYLALCIAEGFSPWANHVWLIPKKVKVPSENGEGTTEVVKHIPAVGRDGLLHKARQSKRRAGGYRGMSFGVVCERDTFEVEWAGDEMHDPKVLHRFASKPTIFEEGGEAPDRYRGRVIGAWAKLRIDGEPPVFYYASLREHGRLKQTWAWNDVLRKRQPLYHAPEGGVTFDEFRHVEGQMIQLKPVQEWEGAWDYTSTMVLKSAQSYVCRIGLGVTGFVPVDELRDVKAWQEDTGSMAPAAHGSVAIEDFDFSTLDAPEELQVRLREAIAVANALDPWSWGPAKCEMVLTGRSELELRSIYDQIDRENDLRAQRAEKAEQPAEEEVADAEVVHEPEPAGEQATDPLLALKAREADLIARAEDVDPSSEEASVLSAELDQVQAELRAKEDPGQDSLGV